MRISDWSSDVCSSDLLARHGEPPRRIGGRVEPCKGRPAEEQDEEQHSDDRAGTHVALRTVVDDLRAAAGGIVKVDRSGRVPDLNVLHGACPSAVWGAGRSSERRSEEHTSELQSLMRTSYAVFCLKK